MDDTLFYFSLWLVLHQWLTGLQDLEKRGKVICPLLVTDIARFAPHICECDIPKTRALYIELQPYCTYETRCLPREHMGEEVHEEREAPPRIFYIPVHLFDEWKDPGSPRKQQKPAP